MKMTNTDSKVYPIVMTAMMMCIIMVSIVLFRVPIPFTQGYVNLSDAMIFLAVIMLGYKYGTIAAALGSMLGDLMAGFAMWAPWTFFIKGGMALILGLIIQSTLMGGLTAGADSSRNGSVTENRSQTRRPVTDRGFLSMEIMGMIVAGVFMTAGYYAAEGIMYGNWIVAFLGIPWNIAQFGVGIVLALAIAGALAKTSLRDVMAYSAPSHTR